MAIGLLSHLLLTSSISGGDCDTWGLLVVSTGVAGLVLDPWYHLQHCPCLVQLLKKWQVGKLTSMGEEALD